MNEKKINRFSDMVGNSGNAALVKFWNEIVDDISFWSMVSEENKDENNLKIQRALHYGISKGKLEGMVFGFERLNGYIAESERYLEFQKYLIEKKPENWMKYLNFTTGIIGKDELWK